MKSQIWKIILAVIITAVVVGGVIYVWQHKTGQPTAYEAYEGIDNISEEASNEISGIIKNYQESLVEETDPLSYSTTGVSASVSKKTGGFEYSSQQIRMANDCGAQHKAGDFDKLVSIFSGTTKEFYSFKYTGASQGPDTFVVTLLPNKAGYTSLDQFKKDFDVCEVGGDAYPKMLNSDWLLFVSSCGSGFDDGSGKPVGCDEVKKVVEPTLKLNVATMPSVAATPDSSSEPRVLVATETDASWKTYISPSLGFTMMTPTKGRYAPTWEMKSFNLSDSHVSNGCYYKSDNTTEGGSFGITQDQIKFCQTSTEDNGAGQHDVIDDYATTIGTRVVVIEFTKSTVSADLYKELGCAEKPTEQYFTSGKYCIPFVESEYQATLDGIVGTFEMDAVYNN